MIKKIHIGFQTTWHLNKSNLRRYNTHIYNGGWSFVAINCHLIKASFSFFSRLLYSDDYYWIQDHIPCKTWAHFCQYWHKTKRLTFVLWNKAITCYCFTIKSDILENFTHFPSIKTTFSSSTLMNSWHNLSLLDRITKLTWHWHPIHQFI